MGGKNLDEKEYKGMFDKMEPLAQFSPLAGQLTEEIVPGAANKREEYENDMKAADGADRTMWCYAPRSGCPDSKQTQVLFVLRDDSSRSSAAELMERLELEQLAEDQHFLLLFPNPEPSGWGADAGKRKEDMDFLARCFAQLRESRLQVNGFNGMLYYLAVSPGACALLADMIALRPANVTAAMLGELPKDYKLPEGALGVETAAWCRPGVMAEYLKRANGAGEEKESDDAVLFPGRNPEVRLFVSERKIDGGTVRQAWEKLFSVSRRWQNDTFGQYHGRTDFTARGFTAHVQDVSLGVNGGMAHTWFEYVPPRLRGTDEKVPLVFFFHGVNCVPLYGAEQSNWHEIADREGFIVVYPAPARGKCWNIYDLPILPSDFDFVLALLEHMKQVHPIDESRVYLSGFSMGGMMTHALSAAYPELFAGAAPCNAFAFHRFKDPREALAPFLQGVDPETIGHVSCSARLADEKKAARPWLRMPVFQNAGLEDRLIADWPVTPKTDDPRTKTIDWWKEYDHIPGGDGEEAAAPSGLAASESGYMDAEKRYFYQRWYSADPEKLPLLTLVLAGRMAHALDPVQTEWAWDYLRHFSRRADGELVYTK